MADAPRAGCASFHAFCALDAPCQRIVASGGDAVICNPATCNRASRQSNTAFRLTMNPGYLDDGDFTPPWLIRLPQPSGRSLHLLANFVRIVHIAKRGGFFLCLRPGNPGLGADKHARIGGPRLVGLEMGLGVEDPADLAGERVFEIHGAESQQFIDGARDGAHAGVLVRHRAGLDPRAGHQQHAAVRVHVVHAVLRVVFSDKQRRILPDRRAGKELDDTAQGEVVVRHVGSAIRIAILAGADRRCDRRAGE